MRGKSAHAFKRRKIENESVVVWREEMTEVKESRLEFLLSKSSIAANAKYKQTNIIPEGGRSARAVCLIECLW